MTPASERPRGALLPQEITEFTNAGICAGIATVNFAPDSMREFNGFWATCSTYGSFSYLKYGAMRLFSQLAQDTELKVGKLVWVAGHSGPESAEDSRTHFGIFETGVTQLFPEGHVIDLHPWEYNEVPVVLAAALRQRAPIVALHAAARGGRPERLDARGAAGARADRALDGAVPGRLQLARALSHAGGSPGRRPHLCDLPEGRLEGTFAGFDECGFLIVATERGQRTVRSGEVFAW